MSRWFGDGCRFCALLRVASDGRQQVIEATDFVRPSASRLLAPSGLLLRVVAGQSRLLDPRAESSDAETIQTPV